MPGNSQFRWPEQNVSRETSPLRRRGCGIDTRQASSQPSPVAMTQLPELIGVCQPSLAAVRSWQSPWRGVRSFVDRRRMFHVKHLRSIEEVAGTTRLKPRRNRRPGAQVLPPQPVGTCPPSPAAMRSCKSPCRPIRSFVGWRRMFHVKHLRSGEEAAGTTRAKPRRNRRPGALAQLPELVGVCQPSRAAMRSWKSPCRALRSFVGRSRMFHVKHLRSGEEAAESTRAKPRRNHRLSQ